jgi:hypothetical protein
VFGALLARITGSAVGKVPAAAVVAVAVGVAAALLLGVISIGGREADGPGDVETPSELTVEEVCTGGLMKRWCNQDASFTRRLRVAAWAWRLTKHRRSNG